MKTAGGGRILDAAQQFGLHPQPLIDFCEPAEPFVDREPAYGEHGHQLHNGFECDGHHQTFVLLAAGATARAKEDGKQCDQQAEGQSQRSL